jgi:scyllo-inositol 2-dehydrogenase (NADP+)
LVNAPLPKFLVLGEKGSYIKFGLDVQEKAFKAGQKPEGVNWGLEAAESWGQLYLENSSGSYPTERGDYRHFYQNIADTILGLASLKVNMDEAILVLKILEAAFLSHREGRRVELEG